MNLDPGGATAPITGITPGVATAEATITGNVAEYSGAGSGITDGTAAGTIPSTAGVISIAVATRPSAVPALAVTHGSNTIDVPVGTIAGSVTLDAAAGGDFYVVDGADGSASIGYIATTSITPQTLRTFSPAAAGGTVSIDQTVSAALDYFVVQQITAATPTDAQLWVTNGTTTQEIGDLGAVQTTGIAAPAADGTDWGSIVTGRNFGTAALARSVAGAAPTVVTGTALGLDNFQLDDAGSIGVLGPLTFIGTYALSTTEVIVTDGTQAGTRILLSQTGGSGSYGNFTNLGTLMLFTDPSGNLYASDGTAAGTSELLAGNAMLAGGLDPNPTATIAYDGVTYLYFAATVGGQTGLYRTDGHTVQTIQASGLSTTPSIIALNGQILYTATATGAAGATFSAIYATAPATTTGAPIDNPADYVANSYLDPLLAPSATSLTPVTLAAVGQGYTLTTGIDIINGGTGDNTVTALTDTLNPSDTIVAGSGGLNVLDLASDGTFDLSAPVTLSGISEVVAQGPNQTIILRPGTSLDVSLASTSATVGGTVQGANNSDVITGQSQGFYVVTVGGPGETVTDVGRVIEPTADSAAVVSFVGVLELTGGGSATLGPNDNNVQEIQLDQPTQLTIEGTPSFAQALIVGSSAGPDSVTLLTGPWVFEGEAPGDTLTFANGGSLYAGGSGELYGTAAHLNSDTIGGYDFATATGTAALIDVTNLPYSSAETVTSSGDVLTVANGTVAASITITGLGAALQTDPFGAFLTSADGTGGTLLTYQQQVFRLTTGIDTVAGTQNNTVLATSNTLGKGDVINGGAGGGRVGSSILSLVGPGTFDLTAPTTLTGISAISGDSSTGTAAVAQTILLRGFPLDPANDFQSITLGAGADIVFGTEGDATQITNNNGVTREGGDTITLGDARESVLLNTSSNADIINVAPATALASITDAGFGSAGARDVVSGTGIIGVGDAFVGTLALGAGQQVYLLGDAPDAIAGGGNDLIDASFSSAGVFGGTVTVNPGGGGTVIASGNNSVVLQGSAAQLNGVTFEAFNFGPPDADTGERTSIFITDFTNAAALQAKLNGNVLTVTDGTAQSVTITLPGAPPGSFTATTTSGVGTALTFVAASPITPVQATLNGTGFAGTAGNDRLTVTPGQLAAGQTIDGGAGVNTLILSGTGSFDLALPATLADVQDIEVAAGQTVTPRPGLTAEIDGSGATILGAASPDPIVLAGEDSGNDTIVLGSAQATVINGDFATTIVADAQTIGATVYGGKSSDNVLQVTGGGTAVMGADIYDIGTVELGLTGLDFQANNTPGLMIAVSGTTGTPDTVRLGTGSDTLTDTSSGGNTFVSNPADAMFVFGSTGVPGGVPTGTRSRTSTSPARTRS